MKTFNLFFKLVAQNRITMIIGVVFFTILMIPTLFATKGDMEQGFQREEPKLIIVQEDGEDGVSTHLVSYLEKRTQVVSVHDQDKTAEERADDLFYRRADYILTIPRGFGKSFLADEQDVVLDKQVTDAVKNEVLVDTVIQNYLQSLRTQLHFAQGETTAQKLQIALERVAEEPVTHIPVSVSAASYDSKAHIYGDFYLLYMCYVLLMILLKTFGSVNITMQREELVKRNSLGNVGGVRQFLSTLAASLLLTIGLWVAFILIATVLLGFDTVWGAVGRRMTLISFVTVIGIHAFSYFITSLLKKKGTVGFISNLVSLLVAFASGLFVPYEFVHPFLKQLAAVAPPIWLVRSNRLILDAVEMTAAKQDVLWHYIGILVLLTAAYHMLTWVTKRRRYNVAK